MWSRTFARGRRLADSRFFTSSNFLVSPAFSCFSFFPFCVDLYHYNNTPINVALWGTGATLLICPSQPSGFLICFWPEWFFLQVLLSLLRCLGSMASFSGSLNTTLVSPNKVLNYHSEGEWFNSLYVFFVSSIFSRRSLVRSTLFVSQISGAPGFVSLKSGFVISCITLIFWIRTPLWMKVHAFYWISNLFHHAASLFEGKQAGFAASFLVAFG